MTIARWFISTVILASLSLPAVAADGRQKLVHYEGLDARGKICEVHLKFAPDDATWVTVGNVGGEYDLESGAPVRAGNRDLISKLADRTDRIRVSYSPLFRRYKHSATYSYDPDSGIANFFSIKLHGSRMDALSAVEWESEGRATHGGPHAGFKCGGLKKVEEANVETP